MKRIMGCVIGIFGLMSLSVLKAQDLAPTAHPDLQILVEMTNQLTPMAEASLTPEFTLTSLSITITPPEVSPTSTETIPQDATAEIMTPSESIIILPLPDASTTMTSLQTLMPAMTPTLTLRSIQGQALYPNRALGQAFIRVQAFASDNTLLSTTYTDTNGLYSLLVGADQVTRVEIDAPLYLSETLYLVPGIAPAPITLRAGDLNGDSCVGRADTDLLISYYDKPFGGADIDGSGLVDLIDLALLSANYDEMCVPSVANPVMTPTAVILIPSEEILVTEEASFIVTLFPTEILVTEEINPTMSITATETATPMSIPIDLPPSIEATMDETPQS